MDIECLKDEIVQLLKRANPDSIITDENASIFASASHILPRDMLFVCMELKKMYPIDYDQLVGDIDNYSLNGFALAVWKQIEYTVSLDVPESGDTGCTHPAGCA